MSEERVEFTKAVAETGGWVCIETSRGVQAWVAAYEDRAEGRMRILADGSGDFNGVTLRPRVTITGESAATTAGQLHKHANAMCFIARSVNFPVDHASEILWE